MPPENLTGTLAVTAAATHAATLAGEAMIFHDTINLAGYIGVTGTSTPY